MRSSEAFCLLIQRQLWLLLRRIWLAEIRLLPRWHVRSLSHRHTTEEFTISMRFNLPLNPCVILLNRPRKPAWVLITFPFNRMGYNYQHRGTNSKTHSRSGFQYADWLIQVLIAMVIILVKWTAILYI